MLNSVSRSLSDVGRTPSHAGALRRRPLSVPAITRNAIWPSIGDPERSPYLCDPPDPPNPLATRKGSPYLCDLPDPPDLSDLDQPETLLPREQQPVEACGFGRRAREIARRFPMRHVEHLAIADEIDHAEGRHAGLPRAEEIARSAQREIALRDLEAVGRVGHRLQPPARVVCERRLIHQEAERLMPVAPHAAAQLVEL